MNPIVPVMASGLVLVASLGWAQPPEAPLERCRKMDFSLEGDKFDEGWRDRVALEFEIVNRADLGSLRVGLADDNRFVRAMSARALGIRSDKASADSLAKLVQTDPGYLVRVRAVEALGLLKRTIPAGSSWIAEESSRIGAIPPSQPAPRGSTRSTR